VRLLSAAWWPIRYHQRIGKIYEAFGSKDVRQGESQSNSEKEALLQLIQVIRKLIIAVPSTPFEKISGNVAADIKSSRFSSTGGDKLTWFIIFMTIHK